MPHEEPTPDAGDLDDDRQFARVAARPDLDPATLARLVRAGADSSVGPERFGARVALVLTQPGLTESDLLRLVGRVVNDWPGTAGALAAAVVAHPACTDAVALELMDLPWFSPMLARLFSGRPGKTVFISQCDRVFAALVAARHPLAGALALLTPELAAVPAEEGDWVGAELVADALARLRTSAAEAGIGLPTLVPALVGIVPDWAGTPEELLASALAVVAG